MSQACSTTKRTVKNLMMSEVAALRVTHTDRTAAALHASWSSHRTCPPSTHAAFAGNPQHVFAAVVIGDSAEHEEQVTEAIEVTDSFAAHGFGFVGVKGHADAFGAADDGASEVERSGEGRAAWQDETVEGLEGVVVLVDGFFQSRGLRGDDAQTRAGLLVFGDGRREVGAEVEEIVLNESQNRGDFGGGVAVSTVGGDDGEADGGVGFVNGAVGFDAEIVLADALACGKTCGAVVAGFGVDFGESDHVSGSLYC